MILGTFTKDGVTKHAYTQIDRVQLQFEGWTEEVETPEPQPEFVPAEEPKHRTRKTAADKAAEASE